MAEGFPALRIAQRCAIEISLGLMMSELRNTPAPICTVTASHPPVSCMPRNAFANIDERLRSAMAPGTRMNTPLAVAGIPGRPERFAYALPAQPTVMAERKALMLLSEGSRLSTQEETKARTPIPTIDGSWLRLPLRRIEKEKVQGTKSGR